MYLVENPVLQRELLVNLRMKRAFVLLLAYQVLLAAVVYFAWPAEGRLEANPEAARELVNMFFLGQYVLASLMAPSFAASAITGEKERKTYEMLLASPLRPAAIALGKIFASLAHLALLVVASLPIVVLCLPLGGVDYTEVLAAYLALLLSILTFGMISIACSSYFNRTSAALVASYLLILPLALGGVLAWKGLESNGQLRLTLTLTALPLICATITGALFANTSARLLNPPDVGSEGKEVVDLEEEAREAVGLVIQRDQFPDRLFAPPKSDELMPENSNPVYHKEIHSEIFSQGTLMLRLVIQISMLLALPIMAICLFVWPTLSDWYIGYVAVFNVLVGPVFAGGAITSERERQTLDLLLTTTITPWQILWGKLIASLRISSVLTLFLAWPLLLAAVMVQDYWVNLFAVLAYVGIILATCLTTAMVAMFCSVVFRKTTMSLTTAYLALMVLFLAPLAIVFFVQVFIAPRSAVRVADTVASTQALPEDALPSGQSSIALRGGREDLDNFNANRPVTLSSVRLLGIASPFAAASSVPMTALHPVESNSRRAVPDLYEHDWNFVITYFITTLLLNSSLMLLMIWLFNSRWRVSQ